MLEVLAWCTTGVVMLVLSNIVRRGDFVLNDIRMKTYGDLGHLIGALMLFMCLGPLTVIIIIVQLMDNADKWRDKPLPWIKTKENE